MANPNHATSGGGTSIDWSAEGSAIYKALSNPIRRAFLFALASGEALTIGDFAERVDLDPEDVSYHVRVLAQKGLIVVAEERPGKRGAKPARIWRLKDEHLSALAPQSVLASIATRLNEAVGSHYAVIDSIAETVRGAGLPVTLPSRHEQSAALGGCSLMPETPEVVIRNGIDLKRAAVTFKALSHPLRQAILAELAKGDNLSASQLIPRLGFDASYLSHVSAQVGELTKLGCIEQTDVRAPRRGKTPMRIFGICDGYALLVRLGTIAAPDAQISSEPIAVAETPLEPPVPGITRVPLRPGKACSCSSPMPDRDLRCFNCTKPVVARAA